MTKRRKNEKSAEEIRKMTQEERAEYFSHLTYQKVKAMMDRNDWHDGDLLLSDRGYLIKIEMVQTEHYPVFNMLHKWNEKADWSHYGDMDGDEDNSMTKIPPDLLGQTEAETWRNLEKGAQEQLNGLAVYREKETKGEEDDAKFSALALVGAKVTDLKALERQARDMITRAKIYSITVDMMRRELLGSVRKMEGRIVFYRRVIDLIESYLGEYKEATLIRDGNPAPKNEVLTVRQAVLFMDEEVGDLTAHYYEDVWGNVHQYLGVDYANIELFDKWLLTDNHWLTLIPEPRCIVATRPRRTNPAKSEDNYILHFLIRDGERIYRISTGAIEVDELLFPPGDEWDALLEKLEKAKDEEERMKVFHAQIDWMENIAFLQGIIERSEVFTNLEPGINLFQPDTLTDRAIVFRDGENILPDGRPSYKEWKDSINANIQRGSRILFTGLDWYSSELDRLDGRFDKSRKYTSVRGPEKGIYTVERTIKDHELTILYSPGDDVFYTEKNWAGRLINWGYRPRKNRLSFKLYKDDVYVLNYDGISLEDCLYYIGDRVRRRHYAKILPILIEIVVERTQEIAQEKAFVTLLSQTYEKDETEIWEAVNWWKTKNIFKRPLTQDDAKAWRMIKRHLGIKDETK